MKDNSKSPLDDILYISIPEEFNREINGFTIDPSILMPVEIPASQQASWQTEDLSWEMILSAMLKVLAYDHNHKDIDYYRDFIHAVKPSLPTEMTQAAIAKAQMKDFDIAEEIFLALHHLEPETEHHLSNLALVLEQHSEAYAQADRSDLAEAFQEKTFEIYQKLLTMDDISDDISLNAGLFFLKIGSYDRAEQQLKHYEKVGTDKKKKAKVNEILGHLGKRKTDDTLFKEAYDFIQLGKEEEGISKIRTFLEKNPDVWNAWFLLGWAQRRLEKFEEGKSSFYKALELEESNTDIYNELAICLLELNDLNECRTILHKALRLEPENIKIISNLGILALKREDKEEAMGFFRTVLEYSPDDPIATKYMEYLEEDDS